MRFLLESVRVVQPGSAMDREPPLTSLLMRLHGRLLQRLLVAVMLATMLPVATASIICQVRCATTADAGTHHAHGDPADHHVADAASGNVDGQTVDHGPCHLAAVPAVPPHVTVQGLLEPTFAWTASPSFGQVSHVLSPPQPPPKLDRLPQFGSLDRQASFIDQLADVVRRPSGDSRGSPNQSSLRRGMQRLRRCLRPLLNRLPA